jgi:hypothetical protein
MLPLTNNKDSATNVALAILAALGGYQKITIDVAFRATYLLRVGIESHMHWRKVGQQRYADLDRNPAGKERRRIRCQRRARNASRAQLLFQATNTSLRGARRSKCGDTRRDTSEACLAQPTHSFCWCAPQVSTLTLLKYYLPPPITTDHRCAMQTTLVQWLS